MFFNKLRSVRIDDFFPSKSYDSGVVAVIVPTVFVVHVLLFFFMVMVVNLAAMAHFVVLVVAARIGARLGLERRFH